MLGLVNKHEAQKTIIESTFEGEHSIDISYFFIEVSSIHFILLLKDEQSKAIKGSSIKENLKKKFLISLYIFKVCSQSFLPSASFYLPKLSNLSLQGTFLRILVFLNRDLRTLHMGFFHTFNVLLRTNNPKLSQEHCFQEFPNMISQHYCTLQQCSLQCIVGTSLPSILSFACHAPLLFVPSALSSLFLEATEKGAHISRSIKFPCSFCATFLWQQRELASCVTCKWKWTIAGVHFAAPGSLSPCATFDPLLA